MFLEVSAILGALRAVNEGIAVLKESNDNVSGMVSFFKSHNEAKESVANIEKEQSSGTRRLTQEEALDLAWAKKALREQEKEFKKSIPRDVWNDMLNIQHRSIQEEKHAQLTIMLAHRRKISKHKEWAVHFLSIVVGACVLVGAYLFFLN